MIVVYMSPTLKLLGEFKKPDRIGQTDRGTYIVYGFLSKEEQKKHIIDIMEADENDKIYS